MIKKWHLSGYGWFYIAILLMTIGNIAWADTIPREAQKHMNRGMAAVEMAKTSADYEEAISEFEQAVRLAPDWSAPYFNLGYVLKKMGKYQQSLDNYRKYLELVPNATDAGQVQIEIDQLEYKLEKISEKAKIPRLLEGKWQGYGVCCNGETPTIQFRIVGGMLSIRIPVTYNADKRQRADYKSFPVEIEGKTIRFGFKAKLLIPAINSKSYCNIRYELKLSNPTKLQGKQFNDGKSMDAYFEKLH